MSLPKIKFRFDLPKKNALLLYDEIHLEILKEIIKMNFNTLELRKKKIYFWIYLKQLFFLDFSFKTYSINYIKYTSPKIIITFNDARFQMYYLKKYFKNISFISVMNGRRYGKWFKEIKIFWPNNKKKFYGDYFFVLNKHYIPKYQNLINSKFNLLGHFRNNSVKIGNTKFRGQFLYISQTWEEKKDLDFHIKLLSLINLYLSRANKKIHILLRRTTSNNLLKDEKDFYRKIFQSNCVLHQIDDWKKKYKLMDYYENIIFTLSTMGYEAIARKKKVAIFTPKTINGSRYHPFWPAPYQKKFNFFSSQNLTYNSVRKVLKNIENCSQTNWNKNYYSIIHDQLHYDEKNRGLVKVINNLINH